MKSEDINPELLAFAREPVTEEPEAAGWLFPVSEELLRNRREWKKILAQNPPRTAKPRESQPAPVVLSAGDPVTIDFPRRFAAKPAFRWLASAAALVAIVVFGFAVRFAWRQPGPKAPPDIAKKDSLPPKNLKPVVADQGKGAPRAVPPRFEDALSALKARLSAGIDEQESRRAYEQLLKDYPAHKAEIESDADLAFAVRTPTRQPVDPPKKEIANAPKVSPPPPVVVVKKTVREDLQDRIAAYDGKPLPVADAKLRALREEAIRYLKDHPEPAIPQIEAFVAKSEPTPANEVLYAEARAEELKGSPRESTEVRTLCNAVLTLRLRDDTRPLILQSKPLISFMKSKQTDDPVAKAEEMKTQVVALTDRLAPGKGRRLYLLCVLPPGIREEADDLYKKIQTYAGNPANQVDPALREFLIRARRPQESDLVNIIVPTIDTNKYNVTNDTGKFNWNNILQSAKTSKSVRIYAVYNLPLNRNDIMLRKSRGEIIAPDQNILDFIAFSFNFNVGILGFIDCENGAKNSDDVVFEIGMWFDLYPNISGVYLRNAPLNGGPLGYFQPIQNRINLAPGNPICVASSDGFSAEAVVKSTGRNFITFFNGETTTAAAFKPPDWVAKYDPERFAAMLQGDGEDLDASIRLAASKHLGWIHINQGFGGLVNLSQEEVARIEKLNNVDILDKKGPVGRQEKRKKAVNGRK